MSGADKRGALQSDLLRAKEDLERYLASTSRFKKMLPCNSKAATLRQEIEQIEALIIDCEEIVSEIQSRIDRTPNDKEEQKLLLKELRLKKKELQLEKKQVNSQMRNIREEASVRYSDANTGIIRLMGLTAAQRRDIRINKEAALMPHKSDRDLIERRITVLEKQILWVESIG